MQLHWGRDIVGMADCAYTVAVHAQPMLSLFLQELLLKDCGLVHMLSSSLQAVGILTFSCAKKTEPCMGCDGCSAAAAFLGTHTAPEWLTVVTVHAQPMLSFFPQELLLKDCDAKLI